MTHDHTPEVVGFAGGVLLSVFKTVYEYGWHIFEVGLYGIIGGFCGMLGQYVFKTYIQPRLKRNKDGNQG
jgi:hypothetical protein